MILDDLVQEKECSLCHSVKPIEDFYKRENTSGRLYIQSRCKLCMSQVMKKRYHSELKNNPHFAENRNAINRIYYHKNKEKINNRNIKNHNNKRLMCLNHYGGECACCGEKRREFLSIDHINGNGKQHRKECGGHTADWLASRNFPEGFRVLCHNCNQALGLYGYCPHNNSLTMI